MIKAQSIFHKAYPSRVLGYHPVSLLSTRSSCNTLKRPKSPVKDRPKMAWHIFCIIFYLKKKEHKTSLTPLAHQL